jgi:hypothetical protein
MDRFSQVAPLSVLAAFHGVVAVYFKENYNLFVTNTTHTILSSTVGFLLLLKATLCYRHYAAAKQVHWPRQRARWLNSCHLAATPCRYSRPPLQAADGGLPPLTSLFARAPRPSRTPSTAYERWRYTSIHTG